MLTETQLTEIRNYLLSKKLPIDILIEVNDHFISQISDLQRDENLSFEEAFEKVKLSWKEELHLFWDKTWDLVDTNKLNKKINKENNITILKLSLKLFATLFVILFILAKFFNQITFNYIVNVILFTITFFPILQLIVQYKNFKLIKKYENYKLTYFQDGSLLSLSTLGVFLNSISKLNTNSDYIYQLLNFNIINYPNNNPTLNMLILLFLSLGNFYIIISQKNYLRQIQKVKPFLKYL
jgi:uncharacterized membrane protein